MTRSKLSSKAMLLGAGIGLSTAAFAGSQPAAAYTCPATIYDAAYGCPTAGADIGAGGSIVHHGMGFRSIGAVGVDRFSAAHCGAAAPQRRQDRSQRLERLARIRVLGRRSRLALAAAAQWVANWLVTLTFPGLSRAGLGWAYGLYTGSAAASFLLVARFVRETKGRALEDM